MRIKPPLFPALIRAEGVAVGLFAERQRADLPEMRVVHGLDRSHAEKPLFQPLVIRLFFPAVRVDEFKPEAVVRLRKFFSVHNGVFDGIIQFQRLGRHRHPINPNADALVFDRLDADDCFILYGGCFRRETELQFRHRFLVHVHPAVFFLILERPDGHRDFAFRLFLFKHEGFVKRQRSVVLQMGFARRILIVVFVIDACHDIIRIRIIFRLVNIQNRSVICLAFIVSQPRPFFLVVQAVIKTRKQRLFAVHVDIHRRPQPVAVVNDFAHRGMQTVPLVRRDIRLHIVAGVFGKRRFRITEKIEHTLAVGHRQRDGHNQYADQRKRQRRGKFTFHFRSPFLAAAHRAKRLGAQRRGEAHGVHRLAQRIRNLAFLHASFPPSMSI